MLVPTTFTPRPTPARVKGLTRLTEKGRLTYVYNPLTTMSPTPSMWLVILPDSAARLGVLQGHASTVTPASAGG